jgi:hypothetical protein
MKKCYRDTQLQVLLSPSLLISSDKLGNRPVKDHHLNQGQSYYYDFCYYCYCCVPREHVTTTSETTSVFKNVNGHFSFFRSAGLDGHGALRMG